MLGPNSNDAYTPMAWNTTSTGRSPDWVFSEASSTHLTNDRSWFESDFVELDTQISNSLASIANIPVRGVGTVVLPVKQSMAGQNSSLVGTSLRLENVLYVPDYPCNVVGKPIRAVASIQFTSMTPRGAMVYGDGSIAAIFMPGRDFYQIMLRDCTNAPLGRSVLDEHPEYGLMVSFDWPEHEQQRWRNLQASLRSPPRLGSSCGDQFRFSLGNGFNPSVMGGIQHGHSWSGVSNFMEVDQHQHQQRSRKRGADDDVDCSPRRAKRSRAMDSSNFQPRRILSAVFSRG